MARADDLMLTAEELRLRRRKRRIIVISIASAIAVALLVAFGARPVAGAITAWQSRRHAARAFAFIDQQKWTEARDEAVAAYQLRPSEPEALRALARLLTRTRQPQALEFWAQLDQKHLLTRADRRDEASSALLAGDAARAQPALDSLLSENGKQAEPIDWLLGAQFALQKQQPEEAQRDLQRLFDNPKASGREQLQAAVLQLQSAAAGGNEKAKAEAQLQAAHRISRLAAGKDEAALDALVLLSRRALTNPDPPADGEVMSAPALIAALESHPLARAEHALLALELRAHDHPGEREALIAGAIARFKEGENNALTPLAGWLNGKGEFARELAAIPLEKALQTHDLYLQHLDALGALGRWEDIRQLLEAERFPLDPVVQRMYLARSYAQLKQPAASENNWQRALEAPQGDVDKLMQLGQFAEKNGALDIADAAYTQAISAVPKLRPAYQGRLRAAQASRDSHGIHDLLAQMLALWPNDLAIQNDEAYLRLLLLPTKPSPEGTPESSLTPETPSLRLLEAADPAAAEEIEKLAANLVKQEPQSLPHRTLLALAHLRAGRPIASLDAYDIEVPEETITPSALVVRAAALKWNGRNEEALALLRDLRKELLLPEERAIADSL